AERDRQARERAETLNRADRLTYDVERLLREHGDKVAASDRERAESLIRDLRSAIQNQEHERVPSLMSELEQLSYRITEQMYQRVASEPSAGTDGSTRTSGDEVIDAEFRES
ncbi:MAG: Hsp70 family protein, partial [Fimbriimonadales bacterium]|nr:Hsp70 family protein [Fimbriimonadales bacterium]